jgi:hypothetical protein
VVAVMSVQPTSENRTVLHASLSAACTALIGTNAKIAAAATPVIICEIVLIINSYSLFDFRPIIFR